MRIGQYLGEVEPLWCRLNGALPGFKLAKKATALLLVDMVYASAAPGRGKWPVAAKLGIEDELTYYKERLAIVVPNLQRLLQVFRSKGMEVIHGVSHGYTRDGRDCRRPSKIRFEQWPWWQISDKTEILKEVEPLPNEVVIAKPGPGFFGVTDMDRVLTNLGIENLVIGGTITHQCVESTVRGAHDYGFNVVLVEDGGATHSRRPQEASLRALGDWCCKVRTTDDVFEEIAGL